MKIVLTTHVKQRMSERGFTRKQIEEVVKNPDTNETSYENTKKLKKKFRNKTLEVICIFGRNYVTIITAYFI